MAVTNQLCRVTVVAPNTRMDVALPDHVRLCDLQSDLLQHAADGPHGEDLLDDGAAQGGWVLTRLGGEPLDPNLTPRQHQILDGEELYFTPIDEAGPQAVFDDIIDAMATANLERSRKWGPESSRRFGISLVIAALLGGVAAALFTGTAAAMWASFGVTIVLLTTGLIFARALGRSAEAAVVGLIACGYGGVGGLLVLDGLPSLSDLTAPRLMVAGATLTVVAVAAGIGVPTAAPIFASAALVGAALCGGAAISTFMDATVAEAAAVVAAVYLCLIPAMPMLAFRVSRLPMPTIPRSPQQLRADTQRVDGETALRRAERADQHLTGMLTASAVVTGFAAVALALDPILPAILLSVLLTILMFMRARIFVTVRQRIPFLLAAAAGMGALTYSTWLGNEGIERFAVVLVLMLMVGAIGLTYVLGVVGKPIAPTWGRLVDVFEVIMFIAVVPLTLWVWDAFWWVRTING